VHAVVVDAKPHFRVRGQNIRVDLAARAADPIEFAVAQELALAAQASSFMFFSASFHIQHLPKNRLSGPPEIFNRNTLAYLLPKSYIFFKQFLGLSNGLAFHSCYIETINLEKGFTKFDNINKTQQNQAVDIWAGLRWGIQTWQASLRTYLLKNLRCWHFLSFWH
jgi:hypothetical protein